MVKEVRNLGLKNPSILGQVFEVKDIYPRNVLSEVIVGNTEFCWEFNLCFCLVKISMLSPFYCLYIFYFLFAVKVLRTCLHNQLSIFFLSMTFPYTLKTYLSSWDEWRKFKCRKQRENSKGKTSKTRYGLTKQSTVLPTLNTYEIIKIIKRNSARMLNLSLDIHY